MRGPVAAGCCLRTYVRLIYLCDYACFQVLARESGDEITGQHVRIFTQLYRPGYKQGAVSCGEDPGPLRITALCRLRKISSWRCAASFSLSVSYRNNFFL